MSRKIWVGIFIPKIARNTLVGIFTSKISMDACNKV